MINYIALRKLLPSSVFDELIDVIVKYKINNKLRLAHFLAQCAHESANFTAVEENLNYSASGLLKVFPKYFNEKSAEECAHNRVAIASRVYADRMGNGDEDSQEGWVYRGRGFIQLTGKNNYKQFSNEVPEDLVVRPELVSTKYPLLSAAWFWSQRKLNEMADMGSSENEIASITKRVNGGFNGLEERSKYFDRYHSAIEG